MPSFANELPIKGHSHTHRLNWLRKDKHLATNERKYLLAVERGDLATVKHYLEKFNNIDGFDLNVQDALGRNALYIAIEYENIDMIEVLLNSNIDIGESILHAINEEFVEAVEMLLNYQDRQNSLIDSSSCEQVDQKNKTNKQVYEDFLTFQNKYRKTPYQVSCINHKNNSDLHLICIKILFLISSLTTR
jgi:ankyrin repeat protein